MFSQGNLDRFWKLTPGKIVTMGLELTNWNDTPIGEMSDSGYAACDRDRLPEIAR
jgi:hypothetical protein